MTLYEPATTMMVLTCHFFMIYFYLCTL